MVTYIHRNGRYPEWPDFGSHLKGKPVAKTRAEAAVGVVVFIKDENFRVYEEDPVTGFGKGPPIERYFYRAFEITDQTRISWIIGNDWMRVKKAEAHFKLFGLDDVETAIWDRENRYRISDQLRGSPYAPGYVSTDVLKKVAELIGYRENPRK